MLLEIIAALSLLVVTVTSLFAVKTMKDAENIVENVVFRLKDDIFAWVHTQEGMAEVAMVGKVFGAGVMSVLKVPRGSGAPKITGVKAIDELIMGIISKEAPKLLEGALGGQTS